MTASRVNAKSLKLPAEVFAKSTQTYRLLVATPLGDRWIPPSNLDWDGQLLSTSKPAIRGYQNAAATRGVSD
jgi:hypothetical protein